MVTIVVSYYGVYELRQILTASISTAVSLFSNASLKLAYLRENNVAMYYITTVGTMYDVRISSNSYNVFQ